MTSTIGTPSLWAAFLALIAVVLVFDLGLLNRGLRRIEPGTALRNTAIFVALASGFALFLAWRFGTKPALEFTAGYLIEYALSVDNLFVFLLIFNYFAVPPGLQHRALFWGILGAILLRGGFILAGAALLAKFAWMIFVFGAFLVYTGIKLLFVGDDEMDPGNNAVVRFCQRFLRVTAEYHGHHFFVRQAAKLVATPLFLVLVVIDVIDVVFAVDSIPAVFAITRDPFIAFSSNIFAVLGLRSLYFLLAAFMGRFHYLKYALGIVLAFVGVKMLLSDYWHPSIGLPLAIIAGVLVASVVASVVFPPSREKPAPPSEASFPGA